MVIVTFDVSGMHGCNITAQQDVNVAKLYVVSLYVYVVPVSLHANSCSQFTISAKSWRLKSMSSCVCMMEYLM